MIKLLIFIRRKQGLSLEQFIDYYESSHVPLISANLAQYFVDYRRNYVAESDRPVNSGSSDLSGAFDVLTEIRLRDRAALDAMFAAAAEPALADKIAMDEEKFVDRQNVHMYIAEEYPRDR